MNRIITKQDILSLDDFSSVRQKKRQEILQIKKHRRVPLGPDMTIYFENYDTMWWQIHEMLHIEKGGDSQVQDELLAYNPLIPQGNELIATVMIEIDDPIRRVKTLKLLCGFETQLFFHFNGHTIQSQTIDNEERVSENGKTSSIHFVRWNFSPEECTDFKQENTDVIIKTTHLHYQSKVLILEATRQSLSLDL